MGNPEVCTGYTVRGQVSWSYHHRVWIEDVSLLVVLLVSAALLPCRRAPWKQKWGPSLPRAQNCVTYAELSVSNPKGLCGSVTVTYSFTVAVFISMDVASSWLLEFRLLCKSCYLWTPSCDFAPHCWRNIQMTHTAACLSAAGSFVGWLLGILLGIPRNPIWDLSLWQLSTSPETTPR